MDTKENKLEAAAEGEARAKILKAKIAVKAAEDIADLVRRSDLAAIEAVLDRIKAIAVTQNKNT